MANRFLNNIRVNDSYTLPTDDGSDGQAIITDGSGNLSFGSVAAASADNAEAIHLEVKNTSGATINKGTPVYITGNVGNTDKLEIAPADASDASKMPAVGLLETTLSNNSEGYVAQGGYLKGLATATIDGTSTSSNDTVYVKAGGGLTMTKPTGVNYIQNVAKVARVHASNGSLVVSSILRTNDVPTPLYIDHTNQRLGIGTTNPSAKLHILGTSTADATTKAEMLSNSVFSVRPHGTNSGTLAIAQVDGGNSVGMQFTNGTGTSNWDMSLQPFGGNVGIGITSPATRLAVAAPSDTSVVLGAHYSSANTNRFFDVGISANDGYLNLRNSGAATTIHLDSDGDSYFNGGNVGIGTTSPGAKLQVGDGTADDAARVYHSDGAYAEMRGYGLQFNRATSYIRPTTDGNKGMYIGTEGATWSIVKFNANQYDFQTNEALRLKIASDGNVGIGTDSPDVRLEVVEASPTNGIVADFVNSTNAGGTTAAIKLSNADSDSCDVVLGANRVGGNFGSDFFISLSDSVDGSNQERFRITEAGSVGIGTASPSSLLHLVSDAPTISGTSTNNSSGLRYNTVGTAADTHRFQYNGTTQLNIKNSGNVGIGTTSPGAKLHQHVADSGTNYHRFTNSDTGVASTDGFVVGIGTTEHAVIWNYEAKDLIFGANSTERLRIKSNGNVGIGTTSPSATLQVGEATNITGALSAKAKIVVDAANTTDINNVLNLISKHNGSPSATADSGPALLFSGGIGDAQTRTYAKIVGKYRAYNMGGLAFHTQDTADTITEKMTILPSSGNVGIGIASPGEKLHIQGNLELGDSHKLGDDGYDNLALVSSSNENIVLGSANDLYFNTNATSLSSTGDTKMIITNPGNVGIGTTSPSEKLDVNGNANITGDITVGGDLIVNGTTTTLNTTTVEVEDNILQLNTTQGTPDTATAATSGISVYRGDGITQASLIFNDADDTWDLTNNLVVSGDISAANLATPSAPTNLSLTVVGETINVTFDKSTTTNIDLYLVFGSSNGSDYSLISVLPPDDHANTMSVIDDSFDDSGTQAYRVYAQKNGAVSADLAGSISYSVTSPLEPTNLSVVSLNSAYYVQWDPPSSNSRFVTAYNVYKHEHASSGSLARASATLVYTGMNSSYMYAVSGADNTNYHQFWVETTTT